VTNRIELGIIWFNPFQPDDRHVLWIDLDTFLFFVDNGKDWTPLGAYLKLYPERRGGVAQLVRARWE
jgi:hypothetical protein